MGHDEAGELLGAYALDAVDGTERAELEVHLASCPRCRAELDSLREVAGALGTTVEPLPDALWSRIAGRLPERPGHRGGEEPPPMPTLGLRRTDADSDSGRSGASGMPLRPSPAGWRHRRRPVVVSVAVAVAASVVALVLGVGLVRADHRVSDLQGQVARPSSAVAAALAVPGHRLVDLRSPSGAGAPVARVVVVPDGRGYLVSSSLPSLAAGRTYQLWGIVGSRAISLGLLGASPRDAAFTMAGGIRPSRLSITAEPAGGVVVPTTAVVATGAV